MNHLDRKTLIINRLKQEGFRITSQRKLLIDIILQHECSNCKEIYYLASKKDKTVGIATVYRMLKTLEELELIDRKSCYNISYENLHKTNNNQAIFINNEQQQVLEFQNTTWLDILKQELVQRGLIEQNSNISVIVKESSYVETEEQKNDRLCNSNQCDHYCCEYNKKRNSAS